MLGLEVCVVDAYDQTKNRLDPKVAVVVSQGQAPQTRNRMLWGRNHMTNIQIIKYTEVAGVTRATNAKQMGVVKNYIAG